MLPIKFFLAICVPLGSFLDTSFIGEAIGNKRVKAFPILDTRYWNACLPLYAHEV